MSISWLLWASCVAVLTPRSYSSVPATTLTTRAPNAPHGVVHLRGHTLMSPEGAPFLGLGATYMQALRRCKYNSTRFHADLSYLNASGIRYVRVLSMVGWNKYWQGIEIAPVTFKNQLNATVVGWPDYWQQVESLVDTCYSYGLRVEMTIFADAQLMPTREARLEHLRLMALHLRVSALFPFPLMLVYKTNEPL